MKELLIKLNACYIAREWAADKTWEEIYNTCHRGDWLLWLFKKTNKGDLKLLTLAKGHCAATVKHLIKDKRSIRALEAAISFGNGEIDINQLNNTAAYAYAAAYAADSCACATAAAYAAAYAADSCACATAAAYAADSCACATAAAYAAAYAAARKKNQLLTANIVRKYIPIEKWNISLQGTLVKL